MNYFVAGGGLAGFTAAIELGMQGHTVTLCEQSKTLGGRAATHHQQGYGINIGPHEFYRAGVMKAQFDAWRIPIRGNVPLGKGQAFLIANGARYRFPANAAALFRTKAFSLGDKLRVGQVLAALPRATANDGNPGAVVTLNGRLHSVVTVEPDGDRIRSVYFVLNPDKLQLLTQTLQTES